MPEFLRLDTGDVHWRVRRDAKELLFGPDGLELDRWIKSGQATIVKNGPHRTVYRVQFADRSFYLKHYRVPDARAMLSQWAQRSRGRREWDLMRRAADCDVPTIVPVAIGERRRRRFVFDNYLVTEGVDDVESLFGFVRTVLPTLPEAEQPGVRRRLTWALAELTAKMHESGILHRDFHAGNILVRLGSDGVVQPFLIDLQAAQARRSASWRAARTEVLTLGVNFLSDATAADQLRFLRRYLELRTSLRQPSRGDRFHQLARDLRRRLWRLAHRNWRHRDALAVSNNRRFLFRDIGSAHGYAVVELGEPLFLALLRDPDAPLDVPPDQLLKDTSTRVVARTLPVGGVPMPVIYKRHKDSKPFDAVRLLLYRGPAMRAWIAGHALLMRGIATPRPLAVIERTRWRLVRETYLVTERIENAMSLKSYMTKLVPTLPPRERRHRVRWLAAELGRLVRRLHERQISHRDMKAANFLVAAQSNASNDGDPVTSAPSLPDSAAPKLYVIDLDGVQLWRRLPQFRTLQNLARICVSSMRLPGVTRTDRLRFLRAYLPHGLCDAAVWKPLARAIAAKATQKIALNERLGRPVG